MTPPELLAETTVPPEPAVARAEIHAAADAVQPLTTAPLDVRTEDILAAGKRLWVRGRLVVPVETAPEEEPATRWRLWSKSRPEQPSEVRVQTSVNGRVCEAQVPLSADLHFEVLFEAEPPPRARNWRIANHALTSLGQTVQRSSVVLTPPRKARVAIVVVLPLKYSSGPGSIQRLAQSFDARGLAPVLRRLSQGPGGRQPVYYVASVPPGQENHQAELALAAAALGWPHGHFVVVPGTSDDPPGSLTQAVDRLRWLFNGSLELVVLNLEPLACAALTANQEVHEDRAKVDRLVHPDEDPWKAVAVPPADESPAAAVVVRPRRAGLVTQYPIVFCHGMLAMSTLRMQLPEELNCFFPLRDQLRARGFEVLLPQVAPTSGVKERAEQLRDQIRRWTTDPINVIAHSMGGLDARAMITHLGMANRVRSLTTVATPHRGTFLADWFQTNFRHRLPLLLAMEAMGVNMDGVRDCQRANCTEFNRQTPNMPGVRYFSFGGAVTPSRVTPALRRGLNLLMPIEGPNDGLVSLHSACWGEYLGTLQADHYAQTPDSVFVRPGEDFDSPAFYLRLVEDLARRGF